MRLSALSLGALIGGIAVGCGPDKRAAAENPVKWTVSDSTAQLHAGTATTLRLAAAIDSGWYIYSITQKPGGPTPMTISVAPSPPFSLDGSAVGPQPIVIFDKEFGIETERYEGNPAFAVPVSVAATSGAETKTLDIKVRYQACNASFCLPARTTVLTTRVEVAGRT
ncbi:MAG TPA: protein-disulfide reductase DsbD N-terminal domain-containing protein [Gemmatimonadaceae bacterium]|nr:protein-disulfide reductase DsbD N-terminal domain-containing protein [Gemmatimonadaceae bacterium]